MIVGIGVDLVDIARFERTIERTPRLRERLFAASERELPARSLAARYAAKEALIKALGGSDNVYWTEIEITPEPSGRPWFTLSGSTSAEVQRRGITTLHLSMSHDAGLATAYVVAEASGTGGAPAPAPPAAASTTPAVRNHIRGEKPPQKWFLAQKVVSRGEGGAKPGPGPAQDAATSDPTQDAAASDPTQDAAAPAQVQDAATSGSAEARA